MRFICRKCKCVTHSEGYRFNYIRKYGFLCFICNPDYQRIDKEFKEKFDKIDKNDDKKIFELFDECKIKINEEIYDLEV